MKSIVIGIDFQNQSYAAMKFAVNVALKMDSSLVLVFVNKSDRSKDIFQRPKDKVYAEAEERFEDLIKKYTDQISKEKISYVITEGKVPEALDRQATKNRAELIVIGTHGRPAFKLFSSSGAFQVVTTSSVPVVTIKDGAIINNDIRKILVPIDATLESRQKVPFAVRLAKLFDAEIHMLAVYHTKVRMLQENIILYTKQAAEYLEGNAVNFVVKSIETEDIVRAVINYSEEIDADIIASMSIQVESTSNLWKGSYAEQLIGKSHIPVVNIQPKELIKSFSR